MPSETRRPRRDRVLALLMPVVLVLVAASQVVIASTTDLTPWRGGGFGMFSTLDNHDQRFLRITAVTQSGEAVAVDARALFQDDSPVREEFVRARARPTTGNLDALAEAIAAAGLVIDDGIARPRVDEDEGVGDTAVLALEDLDLIDMAVHRGWFDRPSSTLVPERLTSRQVRP